MNLKKKKALISLKKAKGSLDKIISMVERDEYCQDIIIQNLAVMGLIKSSNVHLLNAFMENCDDDTEVKKERLIEIFKLLQK